MNRIINFITLTFSILGIIAVFKISLGKPTSDIENISITQVKPIQINNQISSAIESEEKRKKIKKISKLGGKIVKKSQELFERYSGYVVAFGFTVAAFLNEYSGIITNLFSEDNRQAVGKGISIAITAIGLVIAALSNNLTKDEKSKVKDMLNGGKVGRSQAEIEMAKTAKKQLNTAKKELETFHKKYDKEINTLSYKANVIKTATVEERTKLENLRKELAHLENIVTANENFVEISK